MKKNCLSFSEEAIWSFCFPDKSFGKGAHELSLWLCKLITCLLMKFFFTVLIRSSFSHYIINCDKEIKDHITIWNFILGTLLLCINAYQSPLFEWHERTISISWSFFRLSWSSWPLTQAEGINLISDYYWVSQYLWVYPLWVRLSLSDGLTADLAVIQLTSPGCI